MNIHRRLNLVNNIIPSSQSVSSPIFSPSRLTPSRPAPFSPAPTRLTLLLPVLFNLISRLVCLFSVLLVANFLSISYLSPSVSFLSRFSPLLLFATPFCLTCSPSLPPTCLFFLSIPSSLLCLASQSLSYFSSLFYFLSMTFFFFHPSPFPLCLMFLVFVHSIFSLSRCSAISRLSPVFRSVSYRPFVSFPPRLPSSSSSSSSTLSLPHHHPFKYSWAWRDGGKISEMIWSEEMMN